MTTSERISRAILVFAWVAVSLSLVGSILFAITLPTTSRIPIHFDADLRADAWSGPLGLAALPLVAIASVSLIYRTFPRVPVPYLKREWLALFVSCVLTAAQVHLTCAIVSSRP